MISGKVVVNEELEKRDRNISICISTPLDLKGDATLQVIREVVLLKKNGEKVITGGNGERSYTIDKKLSEIINDTIELPKDIGGISLTIGQIAAAIEIYTDRIAQEFLAQE